MKVNHYIDNFQFCDLFEAKIKNLMKFKADKFAEDKEAKSKERFLLRKIKALEEDKAKAIIAKNRVERYLNQNKVSKDSKSSLTDIILNYKKQTKT